MVTSRLTQASCAPFQKMSLEVVGATIVLRKIRVTGKPPSYQVIMLSDLVWPIKLNLLVNVKLLGPQNNPTA